jgi:CheY-like chemotaxis protein
MRSQNGQASAFEFALSLPGVAALTNAYATGLPPMNRQTGRILLAEDLPMNQLIIAEMLEAAGHTVTAVGDGAAAVAAMRENRFDVVLMDIEMPVMGGLEACRAIRKQTGGRSVPIIAMTANVMPAQVGECRNAWMDGYLSKPIDRAYLLSTVGGWLSRTARLSAKTHDAQYAILDPGMLDDLEGRFGHAKVLVFIASVRKQLDVVTELLRSSDGGQELGNALHDLVSLAGHIGLRDLSMRSRELMTAVRSGADSAAALGAQLQACAQQSIAQLDMRYPEMSQAA